MEKQRLIEEFDEYQTKSMRTLKDLSQGITLDEKTAQLLEGAIGASAEAGEGLDIVKKHIFHGHPLNEKELIKEIGDQLFYIAEMCTALGITMTEAATLNFRKLQKRYPNGFSSDKSIKRYRKIIILEGMDCTFKTSVANILLTHLGEEATCIKNINEGSFDKNMQKAREVLEHIKGRSEEYIILDRFHPISELYLNREAKEQSDIPKKILDDLCEIGQVYLFYFSLADKKIYKDRLYQRGDVDDQETYTLAHFDEITDRIEEVMEDLRNRADLQFCGLNTQIHGSAAMTRIILEKVRNTD